MHKITKEIMARLTEKHHHTGDELIARIEINDAVQIIDEIISNQYPPLEYTKEPPKEAGWFWVKTANSEGIDRVFGDSDDLKVRIVDTTYNLKSLLKYKRHVFIAGPILKAKKPKKR